MGNRRDGVGSEGRWVWEGERRWLNSLLHKFKLEMIVAWTIIVYAVGPKLREISEPNLGIIYLYRLELWMRVQENVNSI